MALRPFRALFEVSPSTPASGGPLGLGRPGLYLMARWARPCDRLSGRPSLTVLLRLGAYNNPTPPLNRVPFTSDPFPQRGFLPAGKAVQEYRPWFSCRRVYIKTD